MAKRYSRRKPALTKMQIKSRKQEAKWLLPRQTNSKQTGNKTIQLPEETRHGSVSYSSINLKLSSLFPLFLFLPVTGLTLYLYCFLLPLCSKFQSRCYHLNSLIRLHFDLLLSLCCDPLYFHDNRLPSLELAGVGWTGRTVKNMAWVGRKIWARPIRETPSNSGQVGGKQYPTWTKPKTWLEFAWDGRDCVGLGAWAEEEEWS